jgi:hypothetical protein
MIVPATRVHRTLYALSVAVASWVEGRSSNAAADAA